jgi:hypothetical protein
MALTNIRQVGILPSGFALYVGDNEVGGRTYMTDELGAAFWDTALTDEHTLLAAIVEEQRLRYKEIIEKKYAS